MSKERLISREKVFGGVVEKYITESSMVVSDNDLTAGGCSTIIREVFIPDPKITKIETSIDFKPTKIKIKREKAKKLKKWSKLHKDFKSIIRQQYSDRCKIIPGQVGSFDDWCKNNYDIDYNK